MAAGWELWPGDEKFLLSPSPEIDWLKVESLLSQQEWDAVERDLNAFASRHNDSTWSSRVAQLRAELRMRRGRDYERQGLLHQARAEYVQTTESPLEHSVVKAAEAAILNLDEQLHQSQSAELLRHPAIAAGALLLAATLGLGILLWNRSASARLRYAARCLRRARIAMSPEHRDTLVREAAYTLAQFPIDDTRVASFWTIPVLQASTHATNGVRPATIAVTTPAIKPEEVVDAARASQAAPDLIAGHCLEWLKSPGARARHQKRRNREVREWLVAHLEPQESDSSESLEAKLRLLSEYEAAVSPREMWTRRYRLRAHYQLGQFIEALEAAKSLSRERLAAPHLEEWARLTAGCYLQSEQWGPAERFLKSIAKRKLGIAELPEWQRMVHAGLQQ
jgi:hypothetical protein